MNAPVQAPNTLKAKLLTDLMCSELDANSAVDLDASVVTKPGSRWADQINQSLDVAVSNLERILPLLHAPARLDQMEQHISISMDEIESIKGDIEITVRDFARENVTNEAKWRQDVLHDLCNMLSLIDADTPEGLAELRGVQKTLEILNLTRG